jgi:8-oxo-dGTP pyrophosphatase MutT (NUDIX family)
MSSDTKAYLKKPTNFVADVSVSTAWLVHQQKLLLLQKNTTAREGLLWGVPGGKIETNETPLQGLQRELLEETHINAQTLPLKHFLTCYVVKPNWQYVYHMHYCHLVDQPTIQLSDEHLTYTWVHIQKAHTLPLISAQQATLAYFIDHLQKQLNLT